MPKKILIGVAWPYVNGDLHLGHLAGYLLPADIFARFNRLLGNDVLMVSGSDCHGTPITVEADKQKISPQEIVDIYHKKDVALFNQYKLSYNLYTKTTTENHKKATQEMFLQLLKNGYIVKATMKQYYSEADKKFLPDRYVDGTCPHCNATEQRSDQCESCGRWLEDGELLEPVSKLSKSPVSLKDTEHYFLELEKLSPMLAKYVATKKGIWRDWVYNETTGWLKEGLKKRAITRDMDWAIDLPVDELKKLPPEMQLENYEGKKIYVWFEAVIGYLSAAVEWSGLPADTHYTDGIFYKQAGQTGKWEDYWLNPETLIYNFMGQDNLVFHTLMWPGQLAGSNMGYTLPHNVVVNKFMNLEGKKFSKSRNWSIDSSKMAYKYGSDLVRYYISANLPENKEGDFTWENFVNATNNELVGNIGNFINRTLKFLESKYDGAVEDSNFVMDKEIENAVTSCYQRMSELLTSCKFVNALDELMLLGKTANKYFDDQKIWVVIKENPEQAKTVIMNLMNLVNNFAVLMEPFLPESSDRLLAMLGEKALEPELEKNLWQARFSNTFKLNSVVEILFTKLELAKVLQEKEG
jgi:methionyl-tRNA synthetase